MKKLQSLSNFQHSSLSTKEMASWCGGAASGGGGTTATLKNTKCVEVADPDGGTTWDCSDCETDDD